jgi:transposase InsO family protein
MQVIKLFLSLFSFMLFIVTNRKRLLHVLYMQMLANQSLSRTLKQNGIRVSFEPHEKYIIATLFENTPQAECFFSLVSPKTIFATWKQYIANCWSYPRTKPGRKPLAKHIVALIKRMKLDNRLWGARRIANELRKLSVAVSHTTVSTIIASCYRDGTLKPLGSWKTFISSHWNSMFACDFFTVDIFGFKRFYVFFIMELATRRIVQYCYTDHPNIAFLRNRLSCFSEQFPNAYLIHDNSGELKYFPYGQYGIKGVATVPYAPNMNAYAERFVRTIRRECLDHFVIFTQFQLGNILRQFMQYYNKMRPHMGIAGQIPCQQAPPEPSGVVVKLPILGGLHNHYSRKVA